MQRVNPYPHNIFCPGNVVCLIHLLHMYKYIPGYKFNFIIEANSKDLDQTAPIEAVWSGSILFAFIRNLQKKKKQQQMTIGPFKQKMSA